MERFIVTLTVGEILWYYDSGWGGTLGIFGWGFAARTLETLPYTRARSA